jgi:transposase
METIYVGIDIGKRTHVVGIISSDGGELVRNRSIPVSRDGFSKLSSLLDPYRNKGIQVVIGCEATGHYWLTVVWYLLSCGYEVHVLNPLAVSGFRGTNIRGTKTDSDDAILIAETVKLGKGRTTLFTNEDRYETKELSRFRMDLTTQVTSVKLKIVSIIDQIFPELTTIFADIAGKTAQEVLLTVPDPERILNMPIDELTTLVERVSRKQFSTKTVEKLRSSAKESIGLRFGLDGLTFQLKLLIEQLRYTEGQIAQLDERLKAFVMEQAPELITIPGVSYAIAGVIIGERSDFTGDKGPKAFLAFAGLDPKKNDSGMKQGKDKMSKRGSRYLRTALWMAACAARQHSPMFKKIYETQKNDRGKKYKVALSHVAKKMAYIVHHIMETQEEFKEQIQP